MPKFFLDEEDEESLKKDLIIQKEIKKQTQLLKKKEHLRKKLQEDHDKLMNILRAEEDSKRIKKINDKHIIDKENLYLLKKFKYCTSYFSKYRTLIIFSENIKFLHSILIFEKWIIEREKFKKAFDENHQHIIQCNLCQSNVITDSCSYKHNILHKYSLNDIKIIINFFGLFMDDDENDDENDDNNI